jgi:hypothetical protein
LRSSLSSILSISAWLRKRIGSLIARDSTADRATFQRRIVVNPYASLNI